MVEEATRIIDYDPLLLYDDPYPMYRQLRDIAPVYHNQSRHVWALSRFDDVQAAARDWGVFGSGSGVDFGDEIYGPGDFLAADPPKHDELRGIVQPVFTPKRIRLLEVTVQETVDSLLAPLIEAGGGDFVAGFARRTPLVTLCTLLGVPPSDHQLLEDWFVRMMERIPGAEHYEDDVWDAGQELQRYMTALVNARRDHPTGDLLTAIAEAQAAGRLTLEESLGMWQILLLAGVHTTATLISNALWHLESRAADRAALAADPSRLPVAVEELLRFDAPVQWLGRKTTRPVTIHGVEIPAEARVLLLWASANRDERQFENADQLILDRPPERHLAFGEGVHFCIGAPLARLESRLALEAMFKRIPEYELAGPIERVFSRQERGIGKLPLRIAQA